MDTRRYLLIMWNDPKKKPFLCADYMNSNATFVPGLGIMKVATKFDGTFMIPLTSIQYAQAFVFSENDASSYDELVKEYDPKIILLDDSRKED